MSLLVEEFEGRFLDGPVHSVDLSVDPWMVRFGEAMLDVVRLADHVETHLTRPNGVPIARLLRELDAVIRQDLMNAVRHSFNRCSRNFQAVRLSVFSTN